MCGKTIKIGVKMRKFIVEKNYENKVEVWGSTFYVDEALWLYIIDDNEQNVAVFPSAVWSCVYSEGLPVV